MPTEPTFFEKVLSLRKQMGLSQEKFAKKLRISRNWLAQIEGGAEPSEALKELFGYVEEQWQRKESPTESVISTLREEPAVYQAEPDAFTDALERIRVAGLKDLSVAQWAIASADLMLRKPLSDSTAAELLQMAARQHLAERALPSKPQSMTRTAPSPPDLPAPLRRQ